MKIKIKNAIKNVENAHGICIFIVVIYLKGEINNLHVELYQKDYYLCRNWKIKCVVLLHLEDEKEQAL